MALRDVKLNNVSVYQLLNDILDFIVKVYQCFSCKIKEDWYISAIYGRKRTLKT